MRVCYLIIGKESNFLKGKISDPGNYHPISLTFILFILDSLAIIEDMTYNNLVTTINVADAL